MCETSLSSMHKACQAITKKSLRAYAACFPKKCLRRLMPCRFCLLGCKKRFLELLIWISTYRSRWRTKVFFLYLIPAFGHVALAEREVILFNITPPPEDYLWCLQPPAAMKLACGSLLGLLPPSTARCCAGKLRKQAEKALWFYGKPHKISTLISSDHREFQHKPMVVFVVASCCSCSSGCSLLLAVGCRLLVVGSWLLFSLGASSRFH